MRHWFFYTVFEGRRAARARHGSTYRETNQTISHTRAEAPKLTGIVEFSKTKLLLHVQSELETTNVRPCDPAPDLNENGATGQIGGVAVNARFSNFLTCMEENQYRSTKLKTGRL